MIDFVLMMLRSNRVKAIVFGFVTAAIQKHFPDLMPDEQMMNWLYGLLVAFVAGDTVRPIDPDKKAIR